MSDPDNTAMMVDESSIIIIDDDYWHVVEERLMNLPVEHYIVSFYF